MRLHQYFITIILCLFLASFEEVFATNLRDAIDTAKANNRNIKLEQIRLNSVKTEKTKAIAEFLPNVSADASYGQRNSYYQGQNYDRSTKQKTEEIKIEQPIFDGLHSVSKYREANYKIKSGNAKTSDKIQEISCAASAITTIVLVQQALVLYLEENAIADKKCCLTQILIHESCKCRR